MAWEGLPKRVREHVEARTGQVVSADTVAAGRNCDLSAVLRTATGERVFVKGVRGVSRQMRWLRNESAVDRLAHGVAPRVLFAADIEADGDDWLVVGYEYVPGRPADLSPGSADLPIVATALERLSKLSAPGLRSMRQRWEPTDWWRRVADTRPDLVSGWDISGMTRWCERVPDMVDGTRLLHTDLHEHQFLITPTGDTRLVDWSFPAAGAGWIDTAFLILRLVEAGHTPQQAENWARELRTFTNVNDHMLTAFAVYVAGFWTHIAATGGPDGSDHRSRLSLNYAQSRLRRHTMAAVI